MSYTTYAIGDVHGRADLLKALVEEIELDAQARRTQIRIIFLGDIIDKGPSSRWAMDIVARVLRKHPLSRFIRGNHDDRFFEFASGQSDDRRRYAHWVFRMHGFATLQSYGYSEDTVPGVLAASFAKRFPKHYSTFQSAERLIVDRIR